MTVQINITVTSEDGKGEFSAYEQGILAAVSGKVVQITNPATPVEEKTSTVPTGFTKTSDSPAEAVEEDPYVAPKRKRRTRAEIEAEKAAEEAAKAEAEEAEEAEEAADAAGHTDAVDDEPAEETPAEPEAEEAQQDEEPDEDDEEESLKDQAVAVTTKLVAERKQSVVKDALKKFGVKRVTELKGDQFAAYLEAVGA